MSLDNFFNPKSVAIIGASHTPGKVGYEILKNFVKGGYSGKVFAINPDTTPILGQKVYPSIKDVPEKIDLAVIAVPAKTVPQILKECVEKKVKNLVIISSGFSEIGSKGKKLEEKCKKIVAGKARVIGPNVIGIYDSTTKVDTIFLPLERMARPKEGQIAFISQSGAVGSTILDWLAEAQIGISKFISYGNAMDVNECDLIEYLANDPKTKVITIFLEGTRDGKRFMKIVKKVSRRKPIIVLKGGKTDIGARAVLTHTSSMAGSSKIYSSVFKQTGAIEAANWEELFDFAKAFTQPLPKGRKVVIITNGGGFGVLAADEVAREGLQLPEPPHNLKIFLKKFLPEYVSLNNPIDLMGDATKERYQIALQACLKSKYHAAIVIVLFQVPTLDPKVVDVIIEMKKYGKPILCCASGGKFTSKYTKILESNGIPVYPTPERAVRALGALVRYSEWLAKA